MGICHCGRDTVWNDMCEDCLHEYEDKIYGYNEKETNMKDFYVTKNIEVLHSDGWKYVIQADRDPDMINVTYQEYDERTQTFRNIEQLHGLWPESARLVAKALIEMADLLEGK